MSEFFYAKVIADSIANGIRLTTLECSYPLMIHAQLMTHRMFSRNAQSNRAMPVAKMLDQVRNDPAIPSHWGKNKQGMSADEELTGEVLSYVQSVWDVAADDAYYHSKELLNNSVHKQVANRLTMPFQYIKVIVTATEWGGFFKLRLNDADPTMMELARKMKEAMDSSVPRELSLGMWHLPYVKQENNNGRWDISAKISAARCARVSYNNHDNSSPDIQKDLALADRLLRDGHLSPFEHQATPMKKDVIDWSSSDQDWEEGVTHSNRADELWSGNFRGWIQYRQLIG